MPTYRTPDVYVQEISVFPPSVAEVETAVPAFIGYTSMAKRLLDNDLRYKPTKVVSLLEYESLFGAGPKLDIDKVILDDNGNFVRADLAPTNTKYLYDSLRLFFNNGGGKCYIVSVGADTATTDKADLLKGLAEIARQDEPTILLFPDAAALSGNDLAAVQEQALSQAGKLGDRVALLDTTYYTTKNEHGNAIDAFRSKIGVNNLKYGTAYAPWLKINFPKNVGYSDVNGKILKGTTPASLASLTGDAAIVNEINRLNLILADIDSLKARKAALSGTESSVTGLQDSLVRTFNGAKNVANAQNLFANLFDIVSAIDVMAFGAASLTHTYTVNGVAKGLVPSINTMIAGTLKPVVETLIGLELELKAALPAYVTAYNSATVKHGAAGWGTIFTTTAASTGTIPAAAATDAEKLDAFRPGINAAFTALNNALGNIDATAANTRAIHEQFLYDNFPIYRNLLRGVGNSLTNCPPSGAVAGVYAAVDTQRGVWKAPANVSLSGVIEPVYYFDQDDTDNLNIDVTAGKSINAIRYFAGKGTLIWGARTLAGNDNEWRYISVRRFFNMVEESVKKSTYWAVFEPNDANTWIKVRGMIENYLTQKWREGALAGSTTKDAFFVRCGLGVTMNAQDILEGRMNVEIGMAVVRPAEFIILKFSHMLQKS
jgi:phage tail sheath protein FI